MSGQLKKKYSKEWYINQIKKGKSLQQIAAECETTVLVIREEIYGFYKNPTCAAKWIDMAAENEATKMRTSKMPEPKTEKGKNASNKELPFWVQQSIKMATKSRKAIMDTSFIMNYGDHCKAINGLVIPEMCIGEMRGIAMRAKTPQERNEIERKISYWEKHAKIIKVENENLPVLPKGAVEGEADFKWRTKMFTRYVQYMWQVYGFKVPYLTCSGDVKALVKAYVTLENNQT